MPFVKNAENQVCLALEPELAGLIKAGWNVLNEAEEAAHRRELNLKQELTTYEGQEKARVEAGLYKVLNPAPAQPAAPANAAPTDGSADDTPNGDQTDGTGSSTGTAENDAAPNGEQPEDSAEGAPAGDGAQESTDETEAAPENTENKATGEGNTTEDQSNVGEAAPNGEQQ